MSSTEQTTPLCSIEDCSRPAWCRGWCRMHYQRAWRNAGDPRADSPPRRPVGAHVVVGDRFGRWTVVAESGHDVQRNCLLECRCDCGGVGVRTASQLRAGVSRSCGCLRAEVERVASITHGQSLGGVMTPTYMSWSEMKRRVKDRNPARAGYKSYGGRTDAGGRPDPVRACARLLDSFDSFLSILGERPPDTSIDRIDSCGHYSCGQCDDCAANGWPANVRWGTRRQQYANQRRHVGVDLTA